MATLSERILGGEAGTYVDREVDRAYVHDGTGVLTLETWRRLGAGLASPKSLYMVFDHITPANNSTTATLQAELRAFAKEKGLWFSDVGGGICHQVLAEGIALPGEVVVGADSHTCTLGAFGAFATGVGATDMAAIWAEGSTWFRVPETIALYLEGGFSPAVEAKDLALAYVGRLRMDGATYCALEFLGEAAGALPMDERLTLTNMAVETGAKTGLFYADQVTRHYLAAYGHEIEGQEREKATFKEEHTFDLGDLVPLLSVPHRVDQVYPVTSYEGVHIDQVFVGTCTNGRYEDLARFSRIVRGRQVKVRTVVVPASRQVLRRAVEDGIITTLLDAGCVVGSPGCGPCLGAHEGVLGKGEVGLSTANRNFKNRMGVGASYYLCSVATAAASALAGHIASPDQEGLHVR